MGDELIPVIDVARQHGKRKSTVFKVLKRLRIEPTKQRSSSSKNQFVSCITQEQLRLVSIEMQAIVSRDEFEPTDEDKADDFVSAEVGVFYLIQLEPEFDPGRFKLGFAAGMSERLRQLRCSAPFATVIRTWPCRRLWERTGIDSVVTGCEQLHTEVFRTPSLEEIIGRCERFFALMPPVQSSTRNHMPDATAGLPNGAVRTAGSQ